MLSTYRFDYEFAVVNCNARAFRISGHNVDKQLFVTGSSDRLSVFMLNAPLFHFFGNFSA